MGRMVRPEPRRETSEPLEIRVDQALAHNDEGSCALHDVFVARSVYNEVSECRRPAVGRRPFATQATSGWLKTPHPPGKYTKVGGSWA